MSSDLLPAAGHWVGSNGFRMTPDDALADHPATAMPAGAYPAMTMQLLPADGIGMRPRPLSQAGTEAVNAPRATCIKPPSPHVMN